MSSSNIKKKPNVRRKPIRIREDHDADRPVVLHSTSDDLFIRTGKQVIESCRLSIGIEVWLDEFKSMTDYIKTWSADRPSIRACFCAPQGAKVVLFFVPRSAHFDFELANELADLNAQLLKDFSYVGMVEVGQVPWAEIDRFVDIDSARYICGERPTACQAVET